MAVVPSPEASDAFRLAVWRPRVMEAMVFRLIAIVRRARHRWCIVASTVCVRMTIIFHGTPSREARSALHEPHTWPIPCDIVRYVLVSSMVEC